MKCGAHAQMSLWRNHISRIWETTSVSWCAKLAVCTTTSAPCAVVNETHSPLYEMLSGVLDETLVESVETLFSRGDHKRTLCSGVL